MKTTQFQTELAILGACRDARTWAAGADALQAA